MKGLELSERFYLEFGAPMLHEKFPHLESVVAVGLAGSGSECFGYDDGISEDHDFEPGFCIFVPDGDEIDRKELFALERAYAKLPKEFMGYRRSPLSPVGGNRHGVIAMSDFFRDKTGRPDGRLTFGDWFSLSEQSLAEAVNGKVFRDDSGRFTQIRKGLEHFPTDVRLKKLAGAVLLMGQSGQYNYPRCVSRGDNGAAQLAVIEFVQRTLSAVFLLNDRYMPYYKWRFRALKELEQLSELGGALEYLITSDNTDSIKKQGVIEDVCARVIEELRQQGLSDHRGDTAEGHAYSVNSHVKEEEIRNLHILFAT